MIHPDAGAAQAMAGPEQRTARVRAGCRRGRGRHDRQVCRVGELSDTDIAAIAAAEPISVTAA